MKEDTSMKTITVNKMGREWYVRVFNADGSLSTQASFSTKTIALRVRAHWIAEKFFGDAVEG